MFFGVLLLVILAFSLLLLVRVRFIIEYNSTFTVTLRILFFKRLLYPSKKEKRKKYNNAFLGLYEAEDSTTDLYKKFGERLKLKSAEFSAKIATPEPFLTSLTYGGAYIAISSLLAVLDSYFFNVNKASRVDLSANFSGSESSLSLKIELYITLFSFIHASTYSFLKRVFLKQSGGKNGTK